MSHTTLQEVTKYHKRIDELIEDAEIEAEIEAETKIRSKNTKVFTISFVGLSLLALLFYRTQMAEVEVAPMLQEEAAGVAEAPLVVQPPLADDSVSVPVITPEETASAPVTSGQDATVSVPSPDSENSPAKAEATASPPAQPIKNEQPAPVKTIARTTPPAKPKRVVPAATTVAQAGKKLYVQIGVFSVQSNAEGLSNRLEKKGFEPDIRPKTRTLQGHGVYIGGFPNPNSLVPQMQELRESGFNPSQEKNPDGTYSIILGVFRTSQEAAKIQDQLSLKGFLTETKASGSTRSTYTVQLGAFSSQEEARKVQKKLNSAGFKGSFIR